MANAPVHAANVVMAPQRGPNERRLAALELIGVTVRDLS